MAKESYDDLAESFHLIFQDWEASLRYQADVLARLLPPPSSDLPILDCACGIGTQAIGLALKGYRIEGRDPSPASIGRASREAAIRGLTVNFRIDDMRNLSTAALGGYGAIIAMDNAIPHLQSDADILAALSCMRAHLRTNGVLLISLRDYGPLLVERPTGTPVSFYRDGAFRRIVHQVWDWVDDRRYVFHLFITCERCDRWEVQHFVGTYRAVTPIEIAQFASQVGFKDARVLAPVETGYYQPIVCAVAP